MILVHLVVLHTLLRTFLFFVNILPSALWQYGLTQRGNKGII